VILEENPLSCCRQTKRLILSTTNAIEAIQEKWSKLINRKGVVFHHDNCRLHIFDNSKIERARVKVLHSPYFDLAQSLPFVSVFAELL